jgi:hypothetical protein
MLRVRVYNFEPFADSTDFMSEAVTSRIWNQPIIRGTTLTSKAVTTSFFFTCPCDESESW